MDQSQTILIGLCYIVRDSMIKILILILMYMCKNLYLLVFCIIVSLFTSTSIFASTNSFIVGNLSYTYDDINVYEVSVKKNNEITGNLIIPYSVINPLNNKEYVVTRVADNGFINCNKITSVTLPKGLLSIGNFAFANCTGLKIIHSTPCIPPDASSSVLDGVNNANITFYIPKGSLRIYQNEWNPDFKYIEEDLGENTAFRTITVDKPGNLPNLIKNSDKNRIFGLTILGLINGTDILYLREMAGSNYDCLDVETGMLGILDLRGANIIAGGSTYSSIDPTTDKTENNRITNRMFMHCHNLFELYLPRDITSIDNDAFSYCYNLSVLDIPDNVAIIGSYSLSGLESLTSITLPSNLQTIGDHCFNGCSSLKSISLPNLVREIGYGCFVDCYMLSSINLGSGIQIIGDQSFQGDNAIKEIHSRNLTPPITNSSNSPFEECVHQNGTLYVPKGTKANYLSTSNWSKFQNVIEEPTGVSNAIETTNNVYVANNKLYIQNNGLNNIIQIFNLQGMCIKTIQPEIGTITVELPLETIYIVKFGNTCTKVLL